MKDADIAALRKIAEYEGKTSKEKLEFGWEWHNVGVMTATLNKFVVDGLVKIVYKSSKHTHYLLTDAGRAEIESPVIVSDQQAEVPELDTSELFKYIVGYDDLKELLRESLQLEKPIHVLLWGPPSIAKSVDGHTRVIVASVRGIEQVPIMEVYERFCRGEQFLASSINTTSLKCELKPVYGVIKHRVGVGDTVKVKIGTGREITATRDHSFLEYRGGKLSPVPASNLHVGSLVPVLFNVPEEALVSQLSYPDTVTFSREFGFMIGFWLAEGSLNYASGPRVTFAVFNEGIESVLLMIMKSLGFANAIKVADCIEVRNRKLVSLFEGFLAEGAGKLNKKGTYSLFKKIPSWVYGSPPEFVEGIIAGYFEGDGCASKKAGASIGTSSKWLYDGMLLLLCTVGVATTSLNNYVSDSGNQTYRYKVAPEHMDKFMGILSRSPYSSKVRLLCQPSKFCSMHVPVNMELYKGLHALGITSRSLPYRRILEKFYVRAKTSGMLPALYARRLLDWGGDRGPLWNRLETLLTADIFWAPVTSIELGDSTEVYDLSVRDNENFVTSDGLVTHNTLFLLDIERAGGGASMWLIGSATSRAGLWDAVADRKPRWLLVDELDKMVAVDQSALLSIMERGRIVRAKVGRELDETINCWVIGTANRINKMPPELLSRFAVYQLGIYTPSEYQEVVKSVLANQEGIDEDSAFRIATKLFGKTNDVRDGIRVARLSKRVGVDRAVELLIR